MILKRIKVGKYTLVQRAQQVTKDPITWVTLDCYAAPGGGSITEEQIRIYAETHNLKMEVSEYER